MEEDPLLGLDLSMWQEVATPGEEAGKLRSKVTKNNPLRLAPALASLLSRSTLLRLRSLAALFSR